MLTDAQAREMNKQDKLVLLTQGLLRTGWDHIMSLPRILSLSGDGQLCQEPCDSVTPLRIPDSHCRVADVALRADEEHVLRDIISRDAISGDAISGDVIRGGSGDTLEIVCKIKLNAPSPEASAGVELCVLRSPDKEEFTKISFQQGLAVGTILLDGDRASTTRRDVRHRPPEKAQVSQMPDGSLQLRVFVDKSIVEVFVNGKVCVAMRVYPGRPDSRTVSLRATGCDAHLSYLDAWNMRGIYETEAE